MWSSQVFTFVHSGHVVRGKNSILKGLCQAGWMFTHYRDLRLAFIRIRMWKKEKKKKKSLNLISLCYLLCLNEHNIATGTFSNNNRFKIFKTNLCYMDYNSLFLIKYFVWIFYFFASILANRRLNTHFVGANDGHFIFEDTACG